MEEKRNLTAEERSKIALKIVKILEKEAGNYGVLILDQVLLLHADGGFHIVQGRNQ